jgi:hypothetical protein
MWVLTPNPPAVTPYLDDFAIIWRQHPQSSDPVKNNQGQVFFKASGEYDHNLTDFDDVTHIARRGMRESLAAVRP